MNDCASESNVSWVMIGYMTYLQASAMLYAIGKATADKNTISGLHEPLAEAYDIVERATLVELCNGPGKD